MGDERRRRVEEFKRSGVVGSPYYSSVLKYMAVAALVCLLVGIGGLSKSNGHWASLAVSILITTAGVGIVVLLVPKYFKHRSSKTHKP
jgi:hypothetical protein